jgi:hypothetical protein
MDLDLSRAQRGASFRLDEVKTLQYIPGGRGGGERRLWMIIQKSKLLATFSPSKLGGQQLGMAKAWG